MYYKDDFYKEFRTEKELCEYLEEIDSRAEWIRITSKKLKVAAAGEETCTEVPGISLEALEKDTLSHSRLVLILPERICYIGNSAIKSLKGRARIDGKALADVDKKTLAEILNKCLKVARGRALIRFCEGKIRAVLSGDEKDYAIISMPDMYMVTSAYIHGDYEKATFLNGYADHYSVTASWQLEDTKLTDVYKELMQNYGRKTDKDIKAVVRITTSDVGVSGANIFYSLQEPTRNVILGNALKVTHKNCKGMEDFTENIESIFDYYREVLKTFNVYAAEAIRAADGVSADYYAADELVGSITTDGNGIAQMDNLPLGRYYIVEKETAHGYVLDNEPRYVDLTYRDQDTPLVTYSADWQNARQRVQVEVLKKEKNSDKVLSGAIFGLYAADDIVSSKGKVLLAKDTLIELKTTDEEGKIQFVADLPVDSRYYIKELAAPDGYVTDQEPQEFTFEYQGSGTSVAEYAFTFEDEQTTVELSKADLTDKKELPGASLKVTDEDGNTVDEWVSKEEAHIIKGLIVGKKYKMTETKPADGYVTAESIEFTVENTKEVQKHQMLDDVTKVEISKKDITDSSEVPGAKLIILDKDGKKVESWTSTDKPHMVEKLPVGEYTLREEQAPDGYLIAEDVKFTVKDTGKVQKVKMKDAHPYGKLVIKKTDSTSKAALPGAEFELREKESGKVVEKLVTDKTGTATSGKIPIATYKNGKVEKTVEYILVETKAPNGYELSSKKEEIRFEYKDGKTKVIEIVKEIKNTKSPSGSTPTGNSPKTGDSTNIWLPILLAVLSACGIGGVIWYKKKKGN